MTAACMPTGSSSAFPTCRGRRGHPGPFPQRAQPRDLLPEWQELVLLCDKLVAEHPDLAGIVIGHGTASLEETAYFLYLALKVPCPVVVVGSQRPASGLSTDAGINLVNARAGRGRSRGARPAACWCC